jgi:mono/diheme cytochrome c family protein
MKVNAGTSRTCGSQPLNFNRWRVHANQGRRHRPAAEASHQKEPASRVDGCQHFSGTSEQTELEKERAMRAKTLCLLAIALTMGPALTLAAGPKPKFDIGRQEFMEKCALCHGQDARGTGGVAEVLKKAPADLALLSKKNGGVFPHARMFEVIDGREWIRSHGERDMPIWGKVYQTEQVSAAEFYMDVPYDMEMFARARVLALVDYLHRIQVK